MTSHSLLQQFFSRYAPAPFKKLNEKHTYPKKNPRTNQSPFLFQLLLLCSPPTLKHNLTECSESGFSLLGGAWMSKFLIFLSTGRKEACIIKEKGVGIRIIDTLPWFLSKWSNLRSRYSKTAKQTSAWSDCYGKIYITGKCPFNLSAL